MHYGLTSLNVSAKPTMDAIFGTVINVLAADAGCLPACCERCCASANGAVKVSVLQLTAAKMSGLAAYLMYETSGAFARARK